ncbi:unnamed protein product [Rhizophagus irregularis]|nr:unnamed protein product [Rhizophagus irregularis]
MNLFELSTYLSATIASIYWIKYDNIPDWALSISYSLSAQNPNDPNNPWTLSNTYNQTDENGNILNEALIQVPSENTNLFYSYPTSLLATYLFLIGN